MREVVILDASALLALVNNEPGAGLVAAASGEAIISAVNWSEVVGYMARRFDGDEVDDLGLGDALGRYDFGVVSFDRAQAYAAGQLRPGTRGLSLGDCACLALGYLRGLPVLTADKAWPSLSLPVEVRLIR